MPKEKINPEMKIAAAALRLAARQSWNRLTLDQIARGAKLPLAQVKKLFPDRDSILSAIVRLIDAEAARATGKSDHNASPHDRLFEVMMARMDILQQYRRAILGIMDEARRNPRLIRYLLPAQTEAMRKLLSVTGLKPPGPFEPIAVAGLLGIHALTLCVWRSDHSSDMSRTMAVLDRYLRRVSALAETLFRGMP